MRVGVAIIGVAASLALSGCISAAASAPEWFAEHEEAQGGDFPSLRSVPRGTIANTDQRHWQAVEADMAEAVRALRDHPRAAAPEPTQDPAEFIEQAREDLEATRQAHEP